MVAHIFKRCFTRPGTISQTTQCLLRVHENECLQVHNTDALRLLMEKNNRN